MLGEPEGDRRRHDRDLSGWMVSADAERVCAKTEKILYRTRYFINI